MSHYLYRPHIHIDDKVVTIDFLIRSAIIMHDDTLTALPVDLLHSRIETQFSQQNSLIAPAFFHFVGDDSRYEAPALCVLDNALFEREPAAAWRNARVSVSRLAMLSQGDTTASWSLGNDTPSDRVSPISSIPKRTAVVQPFAQPLSVASAGQMVTVTISEARTIKHNCKLIPLTTGDQK